MKRWRIHCSALLLPCLAALSAGAADEVLEPGAAHVASHSAAAQQVAAAIAEAAEQRTGTRLVALAADVERRADLHPFARERLLRGIALAFARIEPDPAARALIARFEHRPPVARIWLREGGHRTAVTVFDVAAAARYTARQWAEHSATAEAAVMLESAPAGIVERFAAGDETFRRGAIAAVQSAPPARLVLLRDAIAGALDADPDFAALAVPLALRLGDTALLSAAARRGEAAVMLKALSPIVAALTPADALAVLEPALSRTDLGSAVLFAIGRLADTEPAARARLFAALDDPELGGTAAAALARLDDPDVALELAGRLSSGRSGLPERRALLALRLSDSEAARSAIEGFLRSPDGSPLLKQEAVRWAAD